MRSYQFFAVVLFVGVWFGKAQAIQVQDSDEVFSASVTVKIGKVESERDISCVNGKAGVLKTKKGKLDFTSFSELFRRLRQKKKAGKKVSAKKIKLNKALRKAGARACEAGPPAPEPTATPAPQPDPEPTATPVPEPEPNPEPNPDPQPDPEPAGHFDALGNVTTLGKQRFNIPANLNANFNVGLTVLRNKSCEGCHEQKTNRTFDYLRDRTSAAPMFFNEQSLTNQELADLTAYLNRFCQSDC